MGGRVRFRGSRPRLSHPRRSSQVHHGACNFLVADSIGAFPAHLAELAKLPRAKFEEFRRIGSPALVDKQLVRVALAAEMQPKDARDVWAKAGNPDPAALTAMPLDDFRKTAKRLSV